MTISSVIHTSGQSIERVLTAGLPVMLIFWRPSTPVPAPLEPILDDLAREYAGKAILAKVNADEASELIGRFKISTAPTFLFVRDGKPILALATRGAQDDVAAWVAHVVDGKPQPKIPTPQVTDSGGQGGEPMILSDANFQQVINGSKPVLVDFWAPWCGPCRIVAPHIEKLAGEYDGRAIVGKLNVDENQMTAQQYGVMSIPTLMIFRQGAVVDRLVGAQPLQVLQQRLAAQVQPVG